MLIFSIHNDIFMISETHISILSGQLSIAPKQIENTVALLLEGATIPFISRYRKEATGSLDEVQVEQIKNQFEKLIEIDKRREVILKSIEEQGSLTPELKHQIEETWTLSVLEDLYLPFRPKRRTRAMIAKEKGLEPLSEKLMQQSASDPYQLASGFLNEQVPDQEAALQGARDILAEKINENTRGREILRKIYAQEGMISSRVVKGKEPNAIKYDDYWDFSEPLKRCPSHRLLAMRRGMDEGVLKITIAPPEEKAIEPLEKIFIRRKNPSSEQVGMAIKDSYKRLLGPAMETEAMADYKTKADEEAIRVFTANLRQLLLSSPLGQKRVLAIDPGYRSGCKVVCLDAQGNLVHNETIFPHPPENDTAMSIKKISSLVEVYKIEAIAIGNGTAGRETEHFIQKIHFDHKLAVYVVSENGASVYSASAVAREEFPDYDVTVRGAVSIGRRLMDPLAELVKIDPKSIGVGQYQHDVDQGKLKKSLDSTVESCVNLVGVNVNTASKHLLTYVSGLGPQLAQNIVDYRKEHGPFRSRTDLRKVPRMGEKAYEQCAGFLRIPDANNPLDNSAVHPERYALVFQMAKDVGAEIPDLLQQETLRKKIQPEKYLSQEVGMPTLMDILEELAKPGRDPRNQIKVFEFSQDVFKPEDVKPGMELPGIVTNITNFGCFVDIGVKQDGLVHISQMADRFVKNPADVVQLHQQVKVRVVEVDLIKKRIGLTMKGVKQDV